VSVIRSRAGAQRDQGRAQIHGHGPQRQAGGDVEQREARLVHRKPRERLPVEHAQQGRHLHAGLELAHQRDRHVRTLADLGHPLAQRGDDDLAADDDRRRDRQPRRGVGLHQQHQRHGHHELVGHRIEEGAEGRGLRQAPGEIAVEPVGEGAEGEDQRRRGRASAPA